MNERDIFIAALDKPTAQERSHYLTETCGADATLRQRVEELLRVHEKTGEFLQTPLVDRLAQNVALAGSCDENLCGTATPRPAGIELSFLEPSDQPGSLGKIGHYEVQEVIGAGGMGIVLRAFDERLHRVVAIKTMAAPLAVSAAARKRFLREARAIAAVSHDHIVTIHAVEESGDLPYIVMQCVAGQSLQQRIDLDGPLSLREILRIGTQTAAGLAAAHAQGLVHLDIKPANILLENGIERVKITDFGLARAAADASTSQSGVAGTPQYMAPEQARGEALDHRADLFSLGSVLYAMCTGRAPFRDATSMAVLKRVCDDTPSPISEANPDIPDWLTVLINKLQAKNPDDRYQSAAEVADFLSQRLAQLQQPGAAHAVQLETASLPSGPKASGARWFVGATAALVLLACTLVLTEAGGLTNLATTVIRILTPDGTLVVETTDPGVKVTVEGDGGLVIKGSGLEEIRLRPGSYKVRADKGGKPVPLETELVSIATADREVIKVKIESPPAIAAAKPERGAFLLLGGMGVAERKFDTLAQAVLAASDGDTIEIRGNGPFVSEPISIQRTALTIRAGESFRPLIKLSPEASRQKGTFLTTNAALVLEGLELHRAPPKDWVSGGWTTVRSDGAPLRAANCRFRAPVWVRPSPTCVFRNCEFLSADGSGVAGRFRSGSKLIFENCLHRLNGFPIGFEPDNGPFRDASIQIKRSTFASNGTSLRLLLRSPLPARSDSPQNSDAIHIEVSESIFDSPSLLGFEQTPESLDKTAVLEPAEAEKALLRLVQWRGERNRFAPASTSVAWRANLQLLPRHGPKGLEEWNWFWGAGETDSLEGHLRFQGGNSLARTAANLDQLTPDDFRLRADSAGYRAGPDGKDLGADVDLVGPGVAYERWKQTPEYKDWLKETGQMK